MICANIKKNILHEMQCIDFKDIFEIINFNVSSSIIRYIAPLKLVFKSILATNKIYFI